MLENSDIGRHWESWQQRWDDFTPSRATWLWSSIGASLLTVAIGFSVCGWMTRAQADNAAMQAASIARADLIERACFWNTANGPDLRAWLASLKDTNGSARTDMLAEKTAGVKLAGFEKPLAAAVDLCADELATTNPAHRPAEPKG